MLAQTGRDIRRHWSAPWLATSEVSYDPKYGYVIRFVSDENGLLSRLIGYFVFDAQFYYTARDYRPIKP